MKNAKCSLSPSSLECLRRGLIKKMVHWKVKGSVVRFVCHEVQTSWDNVINKILLLYSKIDLILKEQSKFGFTTTTCKFGICNYGLATSSLTFFLLDDSIFPFDKLFLALLLMLFFAFFLPMDFHLIVSLLAFHFIFHKFISFTPYLNYS